MLKMAPRTEELDRFDRIVRAAFVTCVFGLYAILLVFLGQEMHQEYVHYKPGVPHFDPRMMTPEAQHQMFSLRD